MVYRDTRWSCPRDGTALESVRVGAHGFMRCPSCRGAFLEAAVLGAMYSAMGGAAPAERPVTAARPLACPSCREPLARALVAAEPAAEIDACELHGVWFDRGELERVLEQVGLDALAARRLP